MNKKSQTVCTHSKLAGLLLALLVWTFDPVNSFLYCDSNKCGEPVVQPDHSFLRIVGGREAYPGSQPWTVMLVWCGYFKCGGTIINNRFILTAAHCFDEPVQTCHTNSKETRHPSNWTVFAGKQNVIRSNPGEEVYEVEDIFVYPFYNNDTVANDVALLKLKTSITYTSLIRPACLPSGLERPVVGQSCIVSGYGSTLAFDTHSLNQVTVQVISDQVCTQPDWYGTSYYYPPDQFCAGFQQGGKDACDGDSGSPLICKFHGRWYASGIVSKGLSCATPQRPGVYTNVSYHSYWVLTTMAEHGVLPSCT